MKIKVTLKDPDGVYESIRDAVRESLANKDLDDDEIDLLIENRVEKVNDILKKWIEYGEYITIEFDTEEETAIVVER